MSRRRSRRARLPVAWAGGLVVLLAGWLALRGEPALLRRGFAWGSAATLALVLAVGLLMLAGFDAFFSASTGSSSTATRGASATTARC